MKLWVVMGLITSSLWAQKADIPGNADVVAARAANQELRFADAEALMLKDTAANPQSSLMWIELGSAELGLKKYDDAELAFKKALGIDPATLKANHQDDFFATDITATRAQRNTVGQTAYSNDKLNPDIKGKAYSDLGEIYAKTKRKAEAQAAWDSAVKANPAKAPLYLGNETIIFYQLGDSEAQEAAAEKAIAVDPTRAMPYFFKAQGLVAKSTMDPKTQKMVMPPGCVEAYQKYLELDPKGQFSGEAKQMLIAAGQPVKAGGK